MDYMDAFKENEKKLQNKIESPAPVQPVVKKTESKPVKFCRECGAEINAKAEICPKCGVRTEISRSGSKEGFSFEKFVAGYIKKFWGLSPFLKIVAGFLTSLFIAPILISIFVFVSSLLSAGLMYGSMYGGARDIGFAAIFAFILVLVGWIGAILIESIGFVMIVYGVRDIWREDDVVKNQIGAINNEST
jgi:ribosomal protein L40E